MVRDHNTHNNDCYGNEDDREGRENDFCCTSCTTALFLVEMEADMIFPKTQCWLLESGAITMIVYFFLWILVFGFKEEKVTCNLHPILSTLVNACATRLVEIIILFQVKICLLIAIKMVYYYKCEVYAVATF